MEAGFSQIQSHIYMYILYILNVCMYIYSVICYKLVISLSRLLYDFHKYGIQVSLTVFLLHEKLLGSGSFWFPYLSTLPEAFTTPAFLPDDKLTNLPPFLKGTYTFIICTCVHNCCAGKQNHCSILLVFNRQP